MTTTAEIMQDMERTRADIRATIDAIEDRVSVDQLVHRFIAPAKAGTIEFGHLFSDAVRANPLALGVTAVGLGWLMLGPQKPIMTIAGDKGVRGTNRTLDQGGALSAQALDADADDSLSTSDQVAETFRRAGDKFEQVKASARDIADEAVSRIREAADQTRTRGATTVDRASSRAREASDRASSTVREASDRASSMAREASATVRQSTNSALHETRKTAGVVGTRIRDAAGKAGGFVREKPIAAGAVLVLGGAALALLLARRTSHHTGGDYDAAPAGMPETPYASGAQATDGDGDRNPTVALTPEEEGPVYAAGNVSAAAGRPASGGNGGTGEAESITLPAGRSVEPVDTQSGDRVASEPSDPLDVGKEWPALVARRTGEVAVDRQDH